MILPILRVCVKHHDSEIFGRYSETGRETLHCPQCVKPVEKWRVVDSRGVHIATCFQDDTPLLLPGENWKAAARKERTKPPEPPPYPDRKCRAGHNDWKIYRGEAHYRCRTCLALRYAERREEIAAKYAAKRRKANKLKKRRK